MTNREIRKKIRSVEPHVWHPFDRERYLYEWRTKYFVGILQEFLRDVKRCHQRIWKGYCDFDLFSIYDWFLEIIRPMLFEFKETRSGSPAEPGYISHLVIMDESERKEDVHQAWDDVLDRMIFLFGEADEQTCSRQNIYEEEYFKAFEDVQKRSRKAEEPDDNPGHRLHFPDEYPEYGELAEKYRVEEKTLADYRHRCKDEAFELFSNWFCDPWD